MFDDIHALPIIKQEVLDVYLAYGWYRWGSYIFTVNTLSPHGDDRTYPVHWLRYLVGEVEIGKKNVAILRHNKSFSVTVRQFSITRELEDLHNLYVHSVAFNTATDLKTLLADVDNEVFDTHVIEVRDGGRLISAGIFDKGKESIAGIINMYDPAYKKYSPGKYLMLLKYLYCSNHDIRFYYPGYFSTQYPVFDYKLFLDKRATEVFVPSLNGWVRYAEFMEI